MPWVMPPIALPRMRASAASQKPSPNPATASTPTKMVANSMLGEVQVQNSCSGRPWMELADGIAGPGSGQYLHGSEPRFHGDGFGSFLAERDAGREHRAGHTLLATGSRATGAGGLHHNRFGDAHGTRRASGVPRDADRHQHIRDSERGAVDFRVCFLHGLLGAVSDRIGGRP